MPLTLADYARYCSNPFPDSIPPYGRWQRLLCRLGVHRWHREYHQWEFEHSPMRRFMRDIPALSKIPWMKINGATYTYKSEAD